MCGGVELLGAKTKDGIPYTAKVCVSFFFSVDLRRYAEVSTVNVRSKFVLW